MELIDAIRTAWEFTGVIPRSIVDVNSFGNVLVEDENAGVWRICPEELSCKQIASSTDELDEQRQSNEFQTDWNMERLVTLAFQNLVLQRKDVASV